MLTPSRMTAVDDSFHTRGLPERCQFPYAGVASLANCSEGWRLKKNPNSEKSERFLQRVWSHGSHGSHCDFVISV